MAVIIKQTTDERWRANAYLVADEPSGHGIILDPNGAVDPLLTAAHDLSITITHVVASHGHEDHVVELRSVAGRLGAQVVAHPLTAAAVGADESVEGGGQLTSGSITWRAIATPGHAPGQIALYGASLCLTADALYAGTVPAQSEPGPDAFAEVRDSVMRLLTLPSRTRLLPGHGPATTVAAETRTNPFVRLWRGLDAEGADPCRVGGPYGWHAQLVLAAADYDGGTKAWVRFPRAGDCLVPGSWVEAI